MSKQQDALKLALEALEKCDSALAEELTAWDIEPPLHHVLEASNACGPAITAIREALAEQPAQQKPTCKQNLQVWVISNGKGRGQFSWEPQDERYWTRMEPAIKQDLTPEQPAQQQEPGDKAELQRLREMEKEYHLFLTTLKMQIAQLPQRSHT